jgi:hypothetical protein
LWSNWWWNEDWQGKPKYSEKTCPSATLSTTNPTRTDPESNPGHRGGKRHALLKDEACPGDIYLRKLLARKQDFIKDIVLERLVVLS